MPVLFVYFELLLLKTCSWLLTGRTWEGGSTKGARPPLTAPKASYPEGFLDLNEYQGEEGSLKPRSVRIIEIGRGVRGIHLLNQRTIRTKSLNDSLRRNKLLFQDKIRGRRRGR
jgi:hypothetical protein